MQQLRSSRAVQTSGAHNRTIVRRWLVAFLVAAVVFYRPCRELVRFAAHSELYSHIFLIPVICFYLVWINRRTLPVGKSSFAAALLAYIPSLILVGLYFGRPAAGFWHVKSNYLSAMMAAMALMCIGNLFVLLGKDFVRAALFPTLFLMLMAPFPEAVLNDIETFFQHSSAWTAGVMFDITGTTVLHNGLFFQLPGITLQVAQECSGIHS
ncbi:MAG: archaeosortase/exosortase family protein, partial [Limisphaerales bacterium]